MSEETANVKDEKDGYSALVPAVEQAGRILTCLAQSPSFKMTLTEICREVGIYKSKGYSILHTLQKFGFVQKYEEGKRYSLGPGLIGLSRRFLDKLDYREMATPFLEKLARETHTTAFFGVINDDSVFIVAKCPGSRDIDVTLRLGHRFPLTAGAHGKAIAAFLLEDERKKMLAGEKLFFHGAAAKLDRRRLVVELEQCRRDGFAVDMGELNAGINAVAAPVFGAQEKLSGSIFIVGTFQEIQVGEYGPRVADYARQISYLLGADVEKAYQAPVL